MEITITNDTNYLRDVEFWAYLLKIQKADGTTYIQSTGA